MAFFTHTMSGILAKGLVIRDKFVNFIPAKFSRTQSKYPTYEKNIRTTALVVCALVCRPAVRRRPAYPTVQRLAHRRHCTGIARRFRRALGRVRQRTLFLAQRRHAPARPHERHPRYARHIGHIGLFGKPTSTPSNTKAATGCSDTPSRANRKSSRRPGGSSGTGFQAPVPIGAWAWAWTTIR